MLRRLKSELLIDGIIHQLVNANRINVVLPSDSVMSLKVFNGQMESQQPRWANQSNPTQIRARYLEVYQATISVTYSVCIL